MPKIPNPNEIRRVIGDRAFARSGAGRENMGYKSPPGTHFGVPKGARDAIQKGEALRLRIWDETGKEMTIGPFNSLSEAERHARGFMARKIPLYSANGQNVKVVDWAVERANLGEDYDFFMDDI